MHRETRSLLLLLILPSFIIISSQRSYSQEVDPVTSNPVPDSTIIISTIDSILLPGYRNIDLSLDEATSFIRDWYRSSGMWNRKDDPLRVAMGRLLFEVTNDPLYRSEQYLDDFNWDNIKIPSDNFFLWDTIHIIVPYGRDNSHAGATSNLGEISEIPDSTVIPPIIFNDSVAIARLSDSLLTPLPGVVARDTGIIDSILLFISDTLQEVISTDPLFPFRYYNYPLTGDSIHVAMDVLLEEVNRRDSSLVILRGSDNSVPIWLSEQEGELTRLWLKNEWGEEISIWIGSGDSDTLNIFLERGVHLTRFNKETNIAGATIDIKKLDSKTLSDAKQVDVKPMYWKFFSEAAFTFNQAVIKNWSKGGESNVNFTIDLLGTVDYTNKNKKISWISTGRFKYGYMASGTKKGPEKIDVRKNVDQIDLASKFNHKAFGKFDFSGTMIFKTQLAPGYNYPNDSVIISKFFNPATLTLGLGLDYKPNKNTAINFAPLSYKGTYVPDTVHIDQTKHGLLINQKARHEPGLSAQVDHKFSINKNITVINKVRLFTNYIHNPLNIDIDWELMATAKLNWFTDIRLNTHLIYDDDTLIPVYDSEGSPVLGPDGKQKKQPNVQFKEIIGLSIIFRF